MSERRKPYQKHLGETELPQELYYFNEGVYIYSERSKRGMLKAPIYAKKLPGLKVRGL